MPALLQNQYSGWLGEQIIGDFTEYARIAYSRFGDRVKHWFTINERKRIRDTVSMTTLTP